MVIHVQTVGDGWMVPETRAKSRTLLKIDKLRESECGIPPWPWLRDPFSFPITEHGNGVKNQNISYQLPSSF